MKQLNYNELFNRENKKNEVLKFLSEFSINLSNQSKGLYLHGPPGSGKTSFINDIICSRKII